MMALSRSVGLSQFVGKREREEAGRHRALFHPLQFRPLDHAAGRR